MTPITLDENVQFLEFTLHGHTFEVDPFQANDDLANIDRQFEEYLVDAPEGGKKFADEKSQMLWLDAIAAHIRERYGAPRCSRFGASQFYDVVTRTVADLKKKVSWTLNSATGSGSTEPECPSGGNGQSLRISPDSTPSGDSPAT